MPLPAFLGAPQPLAANAPLRLAVAIAHDLPGNWCWAGTTAAVASYYAGPGAATSACAVATKWLGVDCCHPPPDPTEQGPRNQPFDIAGPLRAHTQPDDPIGRPLTREEIQGELAAGQPVCCALAWAGSDSAIGHYNLIVGYDAAHDEVRVADCAWADSWLPYDEFRTAYQHRGTWKQSFRTVA